MPLSLREHVTQSFFHVKLLKVRFFYFGLMGMFLCLVICNHRWIEMIYSHSAAYEQAQLEADSEDVSQELSHLV